MRVGSERRMLLGVSSELIFLLSQRLSQNRGTLKTAGFASLYLYENQSSFPEFRFGL